MRELMSQPKRVPKETSLSTNVSYAEKRSIIRVERKAKTELVGVFNPVSHGGLHS